VQFKRPENIKWNQWITVLRAEIGFGTLGICRRRAEMDEEL
jgi:hypothetical protein